MDSNVTVRVRSVVIALAVLAALFAAYIVGSVGHGSPDIAVAAPAASPSGSLHSITMVGVGKTTGAPDEMSFQVGVTTHAADVSTALGQANATMRRVQAALLKQGVHRRDLQTAGLDVHATYAYPDNAAPYITGYQVSERLGVLVRSLSRAGAALTAATNAGGNAARVSGLSLKIGDTHALVSRARDLAVKDATDKARQYATATGQELGAVVSIKEVSAAAPPPVPVFADKALAGPAPMAPVPVRAGTSQTKVRVKVVWALQSP